MQHSTPMQQGEDGSMTSPSRSQNRIATAHHQQQLAMIEAVDEVGRTMDDKWGVGRLPRLVDPLTAARFARQVEKFAQACWGDVLGDVAAHAPAMVRAYQALDQLAQDAGHQPIPPQQWEFEIPEGLVVLVRHTDEIARVQTHGRQCQIWSLEEVAKIVRLHPLVVQVKTHFPGATIEKTRPGRDVLQAHADDLASLPFWGADP